MGGDWLVTLALTFPIFLFSLSVHEAAHAITAKWGGDQTSAYLGRVTLNPIPHIDPIGTILLPVFGAWSGFPLIGWAKPVPVVEQNFRRGDGYGVIVALAGPFSNLMIALFAVVAYQIYLIGMYMAFSDQPEVIFGATVVNQFFLYLILINLALMTFNLIPIPPLDGSHVLWHWFVKHRPELHEIFFTVRQFGFMILLGLLWVGAIGIVFRTFVFPLLWLLLGLAQIPLQILMD